MNASIYKDKIMWPLWYCLSANCQVKLTEYQQCVYGLKLETPPKSSKRVTLDCQVADVEEIGKLIRQPSKFRRAGA